MLTGGLALLAAAACRGPLEVPLSTHASPAGTASSPAAATPAASNAASPVPAPSGPRCHTDQLSLRFAGAQAAAETMFLTFQLANRSTAPCLLQGFVELQMLDATGHALSTRTVRNGGLFANQPPPSAFLLQPTGGAALAATAATFQVAYAHVRKPGGAACSDAYRLQVTPPEEAAPLVVSVQGWTLAPCNGGELDVSPLRPPGVASQ